MSKTMEPPKPQQPSGRIPMPGSKRGIKGFFNEVMRELKKVSWPTARETNRLTGIVLAVCAIVITILFTMSFLVGTLISIIQGTH